MNGCRIFTRNLSKNFWKTNESSLSETEEFRPPKIRKFPPFTERKREKKSVPALPPRYLKQKVDQDWGNVWPAARSFHPASVPLPVRMGYPPYRPKAKKPHPDKWGNLELIKIPNFLHLTPPVIQRQCEALKKFCTPWPEELESKEEQEKYFPVTVTTHSYLHSAATIRDDRSRVAILKVSLKSLQLDYHGRDKLLRIVGDRYDHTTDEIIFVADRCPLSLQNRDYLNYLLTVIYNESMKTEAWENEKEYIDEELYNWQNSPSYQNFKALSESVNNTIPQEYVQDYKSSVEGINNEGESYDTLDEYKNSVLKILGINKSKGPENGDAVEVEQQIAN